MQEQEHSGQIHTTETIWEHPQFLTKTKFYVYLCLFLSRNSEKQHYSQPKLRSIASYWQQKGASQKLRMLPTISYIAWEPSSGTIGNLTFEVEKTDDGIKHYWQTIVYNETFINLPVFLADMQTSNGGNTANLRWQDKDLFGRICAQICRRFNQSD